MLLSGAQQPPAHCECVAHRAAHVTPVTVDSTQTAFAQQAVLEQDCPGAAHPDAQYFAGAHTLAAPSMRVVQQPELHWLSSRQVAAHAVFDGSFASNVHTVPLQQASEEPRQLWPADRQVGAGDGAWSVRDAATPYVLWQRVEPSASVIVHVSVALPWLPSAFHLEVPVLRSFAPGATLSTGQVWSYVTSQLSLEYAIVPVQGGVGAVGCVST